MSKEFIFIISVIGLFLFCLSLKRKTLIVVPIILVVIGFLFYIGTPRQPVKVCKYFHYTLVSEIGLNKEMILKIEFELSRSLRDAHIVIDFPIEFLIYSTKEEEKNLYPSWPWISMPFGNIISVGDLSKNKKYEYNFRIKATKAGYYHTSCWVRGSTFLYAGAGGLHRDVEVTPEGGRIMDYNPKRKNM